VSSIDVALANIDAFEAEAYKGVAWQLDRGYVVDRLRVLVRQPELLNQRALNACGPAVFFRIWLSRDPVSAAAFACKLLRDGSAAIGSLIVAPSWKLLGQNYTQLKAATDNAHPNSTPEITDWMLLSGLRDSENIWFDYAGEPYSVGDKLAGMTLPSTLASWLSATNLYSTVTNNTTVLAADGERDTLLGFIPATGVDIVLFISSHGILNLQNQLPGGPVPATDTFAIPDHFVLMRSPFLESDDGAWIKVDVWTWGQNSWTGWQGASLLMSDYFGTVTTSV
jgi:hypothetical protein